MVVITYVDECLIFSPYGSDVEDDLITSLQEGNENCVFTDQGSIETYLGMDIKHQNGQIAMTQPHLIQIFLTLIGITGYFLNKTKATPSIGTVLDKGGSPREYFWNYRQEVGMLNYLDGTIRPDMSFAVHQVARFSQEHRLPHDRSIRHVGKYLLGTADKGLIYNPDKNRGLECFVDADFAGGWDAQDKLNPENVLSRTGYVIMYSGFPIIWCSKLQTEISLSTTEAEYIALSQSTREVIPFM